jgi:hypothetical protein
VERRKENNYMKKKQLQRMERENVKQRGESLKRETKRLGV